MDLQTEKPPKRSLREPLLMMVLMIGAVLTVVWANLWKSDLRVADVRVGGNSVVADREILSLANISKDQKLYGVDLLAAQKRVQQNAFIKSAAVNREAPNRIAINVIERVPIAAVVLDRIEYLDAEGFVLPPVRSENIFDVPVLTGTFQSSEVVPGKQIVRSDVREALAILAAAQDLGVEVYRRISEIHLEPGKDIMLYTAESGVPVIFGRGDTGMKLAKLEGFWREIVSHHGAHELAYVDLRFDDQVVVRWSHDVEEAQTTKPGATKPAKAKKS